MPIDPWSRLTKLVGAPADASLQAFWSAVASVGTPIHDPHTGHTIFLWRQSNAKHVHLRLNRVTDKAHYDDGLLTHLPGTDIWWLELDLPQRLRASYGLTVHDAHGATLPLQLDQLNPVPPLYHRDETWLSVHRGIHAPAQLEWESAPEHLHNTGQVVSEMLTMDDGVARPHWLYVPNTPATAALPLLTVFDGDRWFGNHLAQALDIARASGRLPDIAVLGVGHPDPADRKTSLSANTGFLRHVTDRSTRWAQRQAQRLGQHFTPRSQWALAGQSLGGLSALLAAVELPEHYGTVIAHSPSMWWSPGGTATPADLQTMTATAWITQQLKASAPQTAIRISIGTHEGLMVPQVEALETVLDHNGWDVSYKLVVGGHDFAWWRDALLDDAATLPTSS